MKISINALTFVLTTAAIGAAKAQFPVEYTNCHLSFTVEDAPERAVSLNQGTTEMLLGLGLEDRMAGTAYLDDAIWPEFADAYNSVPVLEESAYPDITTLMGANPDFIYASYRSAFQAKTEESQRRISYFDVLEEGCSLTVESSRGNATYCRAELDQVLDIQSYLQTPSCEIAENRPDELTLDDLYQEINDIASIFGKPENAAGLIKTINDNFDSAQALHDGEAKPMSVLFLDSWDDETPFVGACCGSINSIIEYAGAVNIFSDLGLEDKATWASANWTDIVERDPDVIIVVDASWDRANEKLYNLCNNEVTRNLKAVQNRRFVTIPFSATTLGVRIGSLAYNLAEAVTALVNNQPLSSVDFTEVSLVEEGAVEALGKSGAIVYTRLPIFKSVDLESFCPGGQTNIFITDDSEQTAAPFSQVNEFDLCFSGRSTVETASGDVVAMKDVRIGDLVKVAENSYEPVYSFGHFDASSKGEYVLINNDIEISHDHLLSINEKGFVPAGEVQIGDSMLSASGGNVAITSLGAKTSMGKYAPFTPSGKIIVNGIIASSFVTIQTGSAHVMIGGYSTGISHAWAAHKFEFVHRLACHYVSTCPNERYTKDGVSTWVSGPRKAFKWLLGQNDLLTAGIMLPLLFLFAVFAFVEGMLVTPVGGIIVASVVVARSCSSRKKKIEC